MPRGCEHVPGRPRVVHVCTESGARAGTPIGTLDVLTSFEWDDSAMHGVVVEGEPFSRIQIPGQRALADPGPRADYPILGWFHIGCEFLAADEVVFAVEPPAGQHVVIAGYWLDAGNEVLPRFWTVPEAAVVARVLDPSAVPAKLDRPELLWLAAPAGDYRGFCGGPVALEAVDGTMKVVAVVLFQHSLPGIQLADEAILAAQPIPAIMSKVEWR